MNKTCPLHGPAPKYTGKEIVTPIASIESIRMMHEQLGETEAALNVYDAISKTLASKQIQTADMGGKHKTFEMGDEIKKMILE